MPIEIALLVLISAILHAVWNALLKDDADKDAAWWVFGLMLCSWALVHVFVGGYDLWAVEAVWPLIALSLCGQLLYGSGLVATYRHGDLSAYYPIVRSTPLIVVVIGVLFLGERYAWPVLGGIALVLLGAFLIQFRPGLRILDNPKALGFALLALCGTGIYALADARAVREVSPPVVFFWIELFLMPIYMLMFRLYGRGKVEQRGLLLLRYQPLKYIGIGLLGYTSYYLILWSFSSGADVAAVASVRQASIPVSVLLGGLWLKESHLPMRLAASLMLMAGIVVIIVNG
jgi:drug/metabolite transporter (DMT)-like permease